MQFEYNVRRMLSFSRKAIEDYNMIEDGDMVAIGISGGKDSFALLCALQSLQKFYPKKFQIKAVHVNMAFHEAGFGTEEEQNIAISKMQELCAQLEVEFTVRKTEIAKIIFDSRKEKNPCSLCSKMRRGIIHETAKSIGCNKIAFGHHFDDVVETFIMNLFNGGQVACFSPVTYLSRTDITLIRPLIYVPEKDIKYFINHSNLPVFASPCPSDKSSERLRVKNLLNDLSKDSKGLKYRIFGAIQRAKVDGFHE